jgi:HD-like signal output (HDOD) protein
MDCLGKRRGQQLNAVPTYRTGKKSVPASNITSPPEARGSALDFLSLLAQELSAGTVELPCFPEVVIRIRNALADPKITPEQRVTIVGAEPRLAARLLQTANSAAFNPSGRPLTELRTAITRLGLQLVQSAAMAFAVQQMKDAESLRSIAKPLSDLWKDCIAVASISQVVARRTKVSPDEAFLTGLLHGIGRLYIMVRAVGADGSPRNDQAFLDLINGWHASIGKAVLENWGFADEMLAAVCDQADYERRSKHEADLSDVLIASVFLGQVLKEPSPRTINLDGVYAFRTIGLTEAECATILTHAEYQVGSLHDALGC